MRVPTFETLIQTPVVSRNELEDVPPRTCNATVMERNSQTLLERWRQPFPPPMQSRGSPWIVTIMEDNHVVVVKVHQVHSNTVFFPSVKVDERRYNLVRRHVCHVHGGGVQQFCEARINSLCWSQNSYNKQRNSQKTR